MQKFVNDPDFIVDDMLSGFVKANPEVELSDRNNHVIKLITPDNSKKTGLVTGGGSGHEPAFLGYIGAGLLDAVGRQRQVRLGVGQAQVDRGCRNATQLFIHGVASSADTVMRGRDQIVSAKLASCNQGDDVAAIVKGTFAFADGASSHFA